MTEIEIPGINEELGLYGSPRIPKRDVEDLPMEWSEDFQLKHLYMSFGKPTWITLRIKSEKKRTTLPKESGRIILFCTIGSAITLDICIVKRTLPMMIL